jgi:hypothetical protein
MALEAVSAGAAVVFTGIGGIPDDAEGYPAGGTSEETFPEGRGIELDPVPIGTVPLDVGTGIDSDAPVVNWIVGVKTPEPLIADEFSAALDIVRAPVPTRVVFDGEVRISVEPIVVFADGAGTEDDPVPTGGCVALAGGVGISVEPIVVFAEGAGMEDDPVPTGGSVEFEEGIGISDEPIVTVTVTAVSFSGGTMIEEDAVPTGTFGPLSAGSHVEFIGGVGTPVEPSVVFRDSVGRLGREKSVGGATLVPGQRVTFPRDVVLLEKLPIRPPALLVKTEGLVTVPGTAELMLNDSVGVIDGGAVPILEVPLLDGAGMLSDEGAGGAVPKLEVAFSDGAVPMLEDTLPEGAGMLSDAEDGGAVPMLEVALFDGAGTLAEGEGDEVCCG